MDLFPLVARRLFKLRALFGEKKKKKSPSRKEDTSSKSPLSLPLPLGICLEPLALPLERGGLVLKRPRLCFECGEYQRDVSLSFSDDREVENPLWAAAASRGKERESEIRSLFWKKWCSACFFKMKIISSKRRTHARAGSLCVCGTAGKHSLHTGCFGDEGDDAGS